MSSIKNWNKVVRQLKAILEAFPKQEERDELVKTLKEMVHVLNNVADSLISLPTTEEAAKAKEAMERLEFIMKHNPLLRKVSFKTSPERGTKVPKPIQISREDTLHEIEKLTHLSEEDLRKRLNQEELYSKGFLRSILSELGRKTQSKASKGEMIDQILTAISTKRTYEGLRGERDRDV